MSYRIAELYGLNVLLSLILSIAKSAPLAADTPAALRQHVRSGSLGHACGHRRLGVWHPRSEPFPIGRDAHSLVGQASVLFKELFISVHAYTDTWLLETSP